MGYKVKEGVILWLNVHVENMLSVIEVMYEAIGLPLVITSGLDGQHRPDSLHYAGRALDIRTVFRNDAYDKIWKEHGEKIISQLKQNFAACKFPVDVVLEGDHLHIEWDERGKK